MSSHSLKSILEILKQPSLTKGKKQEKSSCKARQDAPECGNSEPPQPKQEGPTAIVDRAPRYEPVSQNEKEHNHAPGVVCPACEKRKLATMTLTPEALRLAPFSQAIQDWYDNIKKPTVKRERTREVHQLYLKNLKAFFLEMPVCQIHIGTVLEYQRQRRASVSYVNHETNFLSQLLRYADWWEPIGKRFKPLPEPHWTPPKVLTPDEEERFFLAVGSHEQWKLAYWVVSLTNNTSAMGSELRTLQRRHVFLDPPGPKIHVPDHGIKNEFRARVIPLNEIAENKMLLVIGRAEKIAREQGFPVLLPDHHLFPYRVARNRWDVTRPASRSFLKRPFHEMRETTGFNWLQPRNFRNQLITKLFESGIPDETIISIAGHQSIKMSRYYSRIRLDAKKEALSAILPKKNSGKVG